MKISDYVASIDRTLWTHIIAPSIAALLALIVFQHFWGSSSAVDDDRAVGNDLKARDGIAVGAEVSFAGYGDTTFTNPWPGWVTNEVLELDTDSIYKPDHQHLETRTPVPEGAINIAKPTVIADYRDEWYFESTIKFDLKGQTNDPVKVVDIEVVITSQVPAPSGTLFYYIPQGDKLRSELAFDLTPGATLSALMKTDEGYLGGNYFKERIVTISRQEYLGYDAVLYAPRDTDTEFFIRVFFDNDTSADLRDESGRNFRIVTYPDVVERAYVSSFVEGPESELVRGLYECNYPSGCAKSNNSLLTE